MEKATIKDNKLSLEVTLHFEEEFPIYLFYPESFNQNFEKRSLLDNGLILIESVSTKGYESQEVHPSLLGWYELLTRFPKADPGHFETLKKGIFEKHPEKIVRREPLLEVWQLKFK